MMADIFSAGFCNGLGPGNTTRFLSWIFLSIVWTSVFLGAVMNGHAETGGERFRVAFSSSMFTDVNENDARAAMKVWIMTVARERGIMVDPEPHIYSSVEDLAKFGLANSVNGFGIVTPEFVTLSSKMTFDRFAVGVRGGLITEEYLLIVHRDSGLERLDKLKGRTINVLNNPRMSLALIWLDTILLQAHLGRADEWLGRMTAINKPSQVALPVFFRQVDACLMTKAAFDVMGELNPQLKTQLHILAVSPPFVPSGFAFRAEPSTASFHERTLDAMARLGDSPAGRQILALTQSDGIEERTITCLDTALELITTHARLVQENRRP